MDDKNLHPDCSLCDLPEEVLGQLGLIDNSQKLIVPIILALLIQYQSLDVQRTLLLNEALEPGCCDTSGCPDPKAMQLAASLITLSSLFGFQKQTEGIRCQLAQQNGGCADSTDSTLGMIIILVALIRFVRLLDVSPQSNAQNSPQNGGETQELEELEAEDVEVV